MSSAPKDVEGTSPSAGQVSDDKEVSRREFLRAGAGVIAVGAAGTAGVFGAKPAEACSRCEEEIKASPPPEPYVQLGAALHESRAVTMDRAGAPVPVVPVPLDPMAFLTHFDYGRVSRSADGRTLREYMMVATDADFEVSPGVIFPAWTVNGSVPGPTIRCTEGDLVRVHFFNNAPRDHTIHFHGIHPANMDGALEIVPPGGYYRYEFVAEPFGCFLYHCHMAPLRKHIARGMYGAFIVDPPQGRPPAKEMIMVMHGFDTEMTNEANAFYAVNGPAFYYRDHPIEIKQNEPIRVYLANLTEFDVINSLHVHANVFKLYRTGTRLDTYEITDTVMLCQGERAILEFSYRHPGNFLFHAHQNEFAERGWLGIFRVVS